MDFITEMGILADNNLRLNSYSDIGKIKQNSKKLNALVKEQNEMLKIIAMAQGINIDEIRKQAYLKALEEKAKKLGYASVEEYLRKKREAELRDNEEWKTTANALTFFFVLFIFLFLCIAYHP